MLTCDDDQKESIARALLDKRLIACAKFVPVDAMYWWQGEITRGNEVAIIMETAEDLFDEIEVEVAKIHAYDTFVLTQTPMTNINPAAREWLEGTLK